MRERLVVDSHVKLVSMLNDLYRLFSNLEVEVECALVAVTKHKEEIMTYELLS